jgi:hypothetical protein
MLSANLLNLLPQRDFVRIQPAKNSSTEAAKLLLNVKEIATRELGSHCHKLKGCSVKITGTVGKEIVTVRPPEYVSEERERFSNRFANVSSPTPTAYPIKHHVVTPPLVPKKHHVLPEPIECEYKVKPASIFSASDSNMPIEKRVKTIAPTSLERKKIRAIIRPKFAWKTYHELENYLVEHRSKYLLLSSQKNYTRDQKRYNNKLTQGLLTLASESGYVFEGFTFAAIRDRIR